MTLPGRANAEETLPLPLVSVIIPSFNQGQFLKETIESVLNQGYPNIELIVIDGGSTDTSIDILKAYGDRITWVSEKDLGQGDAVNKGFARAKGRVLGWLNSDDTYAPGAVSAAVRYLNSHPETVMLFGNANYIDEHGQAIGAYPTEPFDRQRLAETCFICQPAVFMLKDVFAEVGPLDIELQTCMDYDYWIRISGAYHATRIAYLRGAVLANSRMYGQNKTLRLRNQAYLEIIVTLQKHFGYVPESWLYGYYYEVVLNNRLSMHSRRDFAAGRLRKVNYQFQQLGLLKGFTHMGKKIMSRYVACPSLFKKQPTAVSSERRAQGIHCAILENAAHARQIRVVGELAGPLRKPLLLHVFADAQRLCAITIADAREFSFSVVLPDTLADRDRIAVLLILEWEDAALQNAAGFLRRRPLFILKDARVL